MESGMSAFSHHTSIMAYQGEQREISPSPEEVKKQRIDFPVTDLILVVEGKELHVNRQVLIDNSPVFKAMFLSGFKERKMKKIDLEGKCYDDFVQFLQSFYPNMMHPVTEANALQIIPLADEYQVTFALEKCETGLTAICKRALSSNSKLVKTVSLVQYLLYAERYDFPILLSHASNLAAKFDSKKLNSIPEYKDVTMQTRLQIATARNRLLETEFQSKYCSRCKFETTYDTKLDLSS